MRLNSPSIGIIFLWLASTGIAFAQEPAQLSELSTDKEKHSYSVGMKVGDTLVLVRSGIDLSVLFQGIVDQLQGSTLISMNEANQIAWEFRRMRQAALDKEREEAARLSLAKGQEFLKTNRAREGVRATASGLQYEVLQAGKGATPGEEDEVLVHYRGALIDGSEFDSSYGAGEPAAFVVKKVIEGWTEALLMMKVGSKYRLYIPPDLAYGERGSGKRIGPNEVLIFEVELLGIK